jgi:hypothetical protein
VGIDEAAELFGRKADPQALDCMDRLSRLARAAGIHLIPSTQKPVNAAINTSILDNLSGRMTFKMISSSASNAAMGGAMARKLAAIKGRAIWTLGSSQKEVQAPYLDEKTLNLDKENIQAEYDNDHRKNFQELFDCGQNSSMDDESES